MMRFRNFLFLGLICFVLACGEKKAGVPETRTSGTMTMLIDDSFAGLIDDQVQVFKSDYPDVTITQIKGSEGKILTNFLNDTTRFIIMSRMLTDQELKFYAQRKIPVNTDRFAIDGIALITNRNNIDTNI
ncbi:MAG: phosphate ABC transporter substrate-binding protein, partial [Pedobacter sp.]